MNYKIKLQELRELNNLSQNDMAKLMNISKSAYNQFEQQYRIITISRLNDISNIFKVSIDYLLNLTSKKQYTHNQKEINTILTSTRLKELRKSLNLTQTKLAEKLNIATSLISDYEKGKILISTHALYTICKKYSISADYLLGKVDNPTIFLK